jgi:uncharacterized membrane protein YcjF (UPF0283 family)
VTGWIVLGSCVLGVLVLVGSVLPLWRRLGRLREIEHRLRKRAEQAQLLAPAVASMEARSADLERALRGVQERAEALQARPNARLRAAAKRTYDGAD